MMNFGSEDVEKRASVPQMMMALREIISVRKRKGLEAVKQKPRMVSDTRYITITAT